MIDLLKKHLQTTLKTLFDFDTEAEEIKVELTNPQFSGDFTFVVFSLLKHSKKGPEATAELIGEKLVELYDEIESFNVVKGFLNIRFKASAWSTFLQLYQPEQNRKNNPGTRRIMVEYSSPNTNKPLHLGHVRNNVLGYAICQILETYGHEVVKVNLINDRGIHICKSMLAYQLFGNGETPASSKTKGDHLVGKYYVMFDGANREQAAELIKSGVDPEEAARQTPLMEQAREMLLKWEAQDPEIRDLWTQMNEWVYGGFDSTYARMGVSFDHIYKESETYLLGKDIVEQGLNSNVFYQKPDGSIWIDLTDVGLDHKLVLRADGTSVYITQDLGTAQLKFDDFNCETSIYVVGNEQDYHFDVLKAILLKLGKPYAPGIVHMSYGMVELPEGKLKTREGKVVDADNLMDEMHETAKERTLEQGKTEGMSDVEIEKLSEILGMGALKYYLLKVDPSKRILFNPAESIDFHGNTGTFIQYTFARCQSILKNNDHLRTNQTLHELEDTERFLIRHLYQFEEKIAEAANAYSPSIIAQYMYDLAKGFNSFYNQCPILKAPSTDLVSFRLTLTHRCANTIALCGNMLGINMPERM